MSATTRPTAGRWAGGGIHQTPLRNPSLLWVFDLKETLISSWKSICEKFLLIWTFLQIRHMFYIKVLSSLCLFLQVMHMLITCRSPGRRLSLSLSNANHTGLYIYIFIYFLNWWRFKCLIFTFTQFEPRTPLKSVDRATSIRRFKSSTIKRTSGTADVKESELHDALMCNFLVRA